MNLRDYLSQPLEKTKFSLLWLDEKGEIECEFYNNKQYIKKEFLTMEVMETNEQDDFMEIWLR